MTVPESAAAVFERVQFLIMNGTPEQRQEVAEMLPGLAAQLATALCDDLSRSEGKSSELSDSGTESLTAQPDSEAPDEKRCRHCEETLLYCATECAGDCCDSCDHDLAQPDTLGDGLTDDERRELRERGCSSAVIAIVDRIVAARLAPRDTYADEPGACSRCNRSAAACGRAPRWCCRHCAESNFGTHFDPPLHQAAATQPSATSERGGVDG